MVGGGVNCLAYTGQSLYLTNWFVRRRGLALSIAFSGVGVGSIVLLPGSAADRRRRLAHRVHRARDSGARAVGAAQPAARRGPRHRACPGWCVWRTLVRICGEHRRITPGRRPTGLSAGHCAPALLVDRGRLFLGLFAWYAVQVHQTKYLTEVGFGRRSWLGARDGESGRGPGADPLGHLSDRIGREWVWTIGNLGFVICYLALLLIRSTRRHRCYGDDPRAGRAWLQPDLGDGPDPGRIFEGRTSAASSARSCLRRSSAARRDRGLPAPCTTGSAAIRQRSGLRQGAA